MFERPHHSRVATVLLALDAERLADQGCLFGGGTAIALRYGEYRESVDIDFLVSRTEGYRTLRQWLTAPGGVANLARAGVALEPSRPVRADQYGIRTMLRVEGIDIKFEIVLEGRIELEPPAPTIASAASPRSRRSTWPRASSSRTATAGPTRPC